MKMEFAEGNGYKLPVARYQERQLIKLNHLATHSCWRASVVGSFVRCCIGVGVCQRMRSIAMSGSPQVAEDSLTSKAIEICIKRA